MGWSAARKIDISISQKGVTQIGALSAQIHMLLSTKSGCGDQNP
jgi:hypothetical protein